MKRLSPQTLLACGAALILLSVAGCAGKGEVMQLDLQTKQQTARSAGMEPVKIVIEPFEDRRADKGRMGMRSHLGGGITYFDLSGGRPASVITQAVINRLKSRGWGDRAWNVRLEQNGSSSDVDIVISGYVYDFSVNARSRVFSTVINTKSRVTVQAKNLGDKSTITRHIEGARSRTVFWFDEEDVQELLAAALDDSIDRLISDTMIVQKALRPVR